MICKWDHIALVNRENLIRVEANGLVNEVILVVDPNAKSDQPETEKAKRIAGDGGVGAVEK